MFDDYYSSILGLWLILTTIMVQLIVAIRVHRGQEGGYSPGKVKPELGQLSIVFRAHRTFHNSIENIIPVLGMAFLAMFSGYGALKLSIIIWIYAIARIIHMILYYRIATEKNPSPRSIPYIVGFFTTFYLMVDLGIHLLL